MDELSEVGEGRWRKAARTSEAVSCSKQKGKLKRTESRGEIGAYEELETLLDLLETLRRVKVGDDEDSRESRGINIIGIVGDCKNSKSRSVMLEHDVPTKADSPPSRYEDLVRTVPRP